MTEDERRELLAAVDLGALLVELAGIEARGRSYPCPSAAHEQSGESPPVKLSRTDSGYELWKCHGCGAAGSAIDALVARGSGVADAFEELRRRTGRTRSQGGGGTPSDARARSRSTRRRSASRPTSRASWGSRTTSTAASPAACCASPTATARATSRPCGCGSRWRRATTAITASCGAR